MRLREERLSEKIKSWSLFVYVQCDIEVPENLREIFTNFPPISKDNNIGRGDNRLFMKNYKIMPREKEFWLDREKC